MVIVLIYVFFTIDFIRYKDRPVRKKLLSLLLDSKPWTGPGRAGPGYLGPLPTLRNRLTGNKVIVFFNSLSFTTTE